MLKVSGALTTLLLVVSPSVAMAHIALTSPTPRYAQLKAGPCGKGATDARTTKISTFEPGAKITVTWNETIGHPGHYRIAFDPNGQSLFTDPSSFTDVAPRPGVLIDNIADKTGTQSYSQEITFPNIECNNCTLQVIQVMTDKAPYGDGNDNYYQCADIVLARADGGAPVADAGGASSSSGSSNSSSSSGDTGGSSGNTSSGAVSSGAAATPEGEDEGGGCAVSPTNAGSGALLASLVALVIARISRRRRS
jgi:MYXO-CTERM domain-containing protein